MARTPLFAEHVRLGAKMTDFAGWEMPLQYAGIIAEHRAVREAVGCFDVSHMGELLVRGPEAAAAVDRCTSNDPAKITAGQAMYTALCLQDGGTVDDAVILCLDPGVSYLAVVNAANTERDAAWMRDQVAGLAAEVVDVSPETALLAVQGPRAEAVVAGILGDAVRALRFYRFAPAVPWRDARLMVARTGYTGEDGFEIFTPAEHAVEMWQALLAAGAVPVGLGARDTLRLEAALPLYGHELGPDISPLEARLERFVALTDDCGRPRSFSGAEALRRQAAEGLHRRLIGLLPEPPGIARAGAAILGPSGEQVGVVTSGTFAPTLGRAVALALCQADPGPVQIEVRGRRVPAERARLPFYRRGRSAAPGK